MQGALYRAGKVSLATWLLPLVLVLAMLAGCTVRLAPDYDGSIVESLQKVNEEAMVFFASISDGTGGKPFTSRATDYANIVGKLDALHIAVSARTTPPNPLAPDKAVAAPPSAGSIAQASNVLTTMRSIDERQKLNAAEVSIFKERFASSIGYALFYEKGLQR